MYVEPKLLFASTSNDSENNVRRRFYCLTVIEDPNVVAQISQ